MPTNLPTAGPGRFRILAPPAVGSGGLVMRYRHVGATLSLSEWRCGGHAPARPGEEWTRSHEVVVPRRGAFEWEIGGLRALADAGSATFLDPAEPYRVRHPIGGGDAGTVFVLPPTAVRALIAEHDEAAAERESARFPRALVPLDGRTYLLHRLALRAATDPHADALKVEERATAFLRAAVAQAYPAPGRGGPAGSRVPRRAAEYAARVSEIVAARYREPITLAEVARAVGASPYHLSRLVTRVTGVPIYRMVRRRRLRDALELVLETGETIGRIAVTVGFASHSHLTDAFRREFGALPRALRRAAASTEPLRAPRR